MDNLVLIFLITTVLFTTTASVITQILPTYNGALTNITCSTAVPSFLIDGIYTTVHYNQLPGLLGIEAIVAPDRTNVTLQVTGSPLVHNVTVECLNIVDLVGGQKETIFHFTLLFSGTIPAPYNLRYDTKHGILSWDSPMLEEIFADDNIDVALRIFHYVIYVTDLQTGLTNNFTTSSQERSTAISFSIMPFIPCSKSLQVSAVNPAGEGQRSANITVFNNQCGLDDTVTRHSTTQVMPQTENERVEMVSLTKGGIVAMVMTLIFVAIIMAAVIVLTLLTLRYVTNKHKCTKSTAISEENPEELRKPSSMPKATESSQTEPLVVKKSQIKTSRKEVETIQTEETCLPSTQLQERGNRKEEKMNSHFLQDGQLIYADLAPPVVNPVPQPSSVDITEYAIINHTIQADGVIIS